MAVLYLTEQGTTLHKIRRRLVVTKEGKIIKEISGFNLERVLIFGNIQLTTQAVAFLLDSGIEVSFLSFNGKFRGRLVPVESKNIILRVAQYERYLDEGFQVDYARRIVEAKIRNGLSILKNYAYKHPDVNIEKDIMFLKEAVESLSAKTKVATIIGVEGKATAAYFRAFGQMLRRGLDFSNRNRRPPRDPVNALLSFGYTLITNEAFSMICAIGFDPYLGYLHSLNYGRPSLALDLVEEFRHPAIDRFTLTLINNQILTEDDFEDRGEEGVYLKDEARKRWFIQYEQMMHHPFKEKHLGEEVTYRSLIKRQAYRLAKSIQEGKPYQPFLVE